MSAPTSEMSSTTFEHFSHPKHSLVLKEFDVIGDDALCYVCNKSVIGSPTYTCSSPDDTNCQAFYLHKSCAELPSQIHFYKHNQHPLALIPAPGWGCSVCYTCSSAVQFVYICSDDCEFTVCVFCAFEQRALCHPGHEEHTLILLQRESLFTCDACFEEAKDSSYVCTKCNFWIHKECALSPFTIQDPAYHHHPLNLIYSIPKMHRYFDRSCGICEKLVHKSYWLYYCYKCTYFVHMKCATSPPTVIEIEEEGTLNEPHLVEFPLPDEESVFDLIITQCCKLQLECQGEDENSIALSTPTDPHIIKHWSHQEHSLVQFQFTTSENDNDDDNNDEKVLICDGCILPITIFHPSYYACVKCGFFLHSFCATKLPGTLEAGVSPFHPQHSLGLCQKEKFYNFAECGVCCNITNGFYYLCKTCNVVIDIRCAFLPSKIKHKSHKHHSLIQQHPPSFSRCHASKYWKTCVHYVCETCSNFQIHIDCAFYPNRMRHRYDDHAITLRQPPFFYEGVFYCEVCEEQVNNQRWLYHCGECDHSFHYYCVVRSENVKLGGSIKLDINNQAHTLTLVLKRQTRQTRPLYYCRYCGYAYICCHFFECDGCGYLICTPCVTEIKESNKSIHF